MPAADHTTGSTTSLSRIAQALAVPEAVLRTYLAAEEREIQGDSGAGIPATEVARVVEGLAAASGHVFEYFTLSDLLTESTQPWAAALADMYRHPVTYPSSLSPEQGDFLKQLVCNVRPSTIVEIGCFTGVSTIWLASALEQAGGDGVIHSIDLFNDIRPDHDMPFRYLDDPLAYAQAHAGKAGLSHRIRFYAMNSIAAAAQVTELTSKPIDFLFIDGDHSFGGCLTDLLNFLPHMSVGGYIVIHDVNLGSLVAGPRHTIDSYVRRSRWLDVVEIDTAPSNYGVAVIRKRAPHARWGPYRAVNVVGRAIINLGGAVYRRLGRRVGIVGEWYLGQQSVRECLRDLSLIGRLLTGRGARLS